MDEIDRLIDQELRQLEQLDPATRAQMASSLLHRLGVLTSRVSITRARALAELRQGGKSAIEIAGILGVTRQQVHRILREALGRGYRPEDHEP
jgi:DNA-binding MarR family transcriptional regulator